MNVISVCRGILSALAAAFVRGMATMLEDPAIRRVLDVVYPAIAVATAAVATAATWLHMTGMSRASHETAFAGVAKSRDRQYRHRVLAAALG